MTTEALIVEQCDREAAAAIGSAFGRYAAIENAQIRRGERDSDPLVVAFARHRTLSRPLPDRETKCAARNSVGANDPQDCNWPVCGCDPHATMVIDTLIESGWSDPSRLASGKREAIARLIDPHTWALVDHFRSKPNRPDLEERVPDKVGPSLAKADAILEMIGAGK